MRTHTPNREIAARLRAARQAKNLTQQEVAMHLDIEKASLSRLELGAVEPRIGQLKALCDLYGITVDSILAD